jgi:hypothetical protein
MGSFRRAGTGSAKLDGSCGATVDRHINRRTRMYYIGIDVSTKESALCILDDKGKIVRETKLPTDPEVIARFVAGTGLAIERIGLESGCIPPLGCLPGCSGMAGR